MSEPTNATPLSTQDVLTMLWQRCVDSEPLTGADQVAVVGLVDRLEAAEARAVAAEGELARWREVCGNKDVIAVVDNEKFRRQVLYGDECQALAAFLALVQPTPTETLEA